LASRRSGLQSFLQLIPAFAGITIKDRINIILKHVKYHLERYGENSMPTFRKHLLWYFKGDRIKEVANIKELRKKLVKVQSVEELLGLFKLLV